jgi:hypothetical protein
MSSEEMSPKAHITQAKPANKKDRLREIRSGGLFKS